MFDRAYISVEDATKLLTEVGYTVENIEFSNDLLVSINNAPYDVLFVICGDVDSVEVSVLVDRMKRVTGA